MIIITALDNKNGMLFNGRRQSQDSELRRRIIEKAQGRPVLMNSFSASQFSDFADRIEVSESFPAAAPDGSFCFIENCPLTDFQDKIEALIIYKWNRDYPGDTFFDLSLNNWKLISKEDFHGSSHEKITEEIFTTAGQKNISSVPEVIFNSSSF